MSRSDITLSGHLPFPLCRRTRDFVGKEFVTLGRVQCISLQIFVLLMLGNPNIPHLHDILLLVSHDSRQYGEVLRFPILRQVLRFVKNHLTLTGMVGFDLGKAEVIVALNGRF
jgi:hypothetical protein